MEHYHRNLVLLLSLSLITITSSSAQAERGQVTGTMMTEYPSWFKDSFLDIADDLEEASETNKHLILFMDLNGCPYCYKMNEENFKNAPYRQYIQDNFDVIGLNVKGDREVSLNEQTTVTEKELAELMGVKFTPGLVFLNTNNEVVTKVNGYRGVKDFKVILDYVQEREYKKQALASYIRQRKSEDAYVLREHPQFDLTRDLSNYNDTPVAFVFEDTGCLDCAMLHDGHLSSSEVQAALNNFKLIRIDTRSEQIITLFDASEITEKAFAESLNVSYTPTIVLFDKAEEKLRIDSMLYRFHFTGLLDYIGARHYETYPESPFDYLSVRTEELLAAGKDVPLSE